MLRHERTRRAPSAAGGALFLVALAAVGVLLLLAGGCTAPLWGPGREATAPSGEGPSGEAAGLTEEIPAGAPLLRVGLLPRADEVTVSCQAGFTVAVYADSNARWSSPPGAAWLFVAGERGVSGKGPGGSFLIDAGTVRVSPAGGLPLELQGTPYRGEIEIFPASAGSLSVANIVDIESYLRGVVPFEIGRRPEAEIEAVKAQAVAARTYALSSSGGRGHGDFDVLSTVQDQVYLGVSGEDPVSDRAVLETAGLVARYHGVPIKAYFHANCGGRTEARHEVWEFEQLPYLVSVNDTPGGTGDLGAAFCSWGPQSEWNESWSGDEVETLVTDNLPSTASTPVRGPLGHVRDLRVTARTPSGRVRWLEVETDGGTYRVFGDRVRRLLTRPGSGEILRSAWFDLDVGGGGGRVTGLVAKGRGYGHGVGMCQQGAIGMARRGHSFEDILRHYYPGVEIARGYEAEPETR
jgi:stage II sporulation protein D